MMRISWRSVRTGLGGFVGSVIALLALVAPGDAHWADLAVAEILVGETSVQILLVFPTGLVASADENGDGRLSPDEVRANRDALTARLTGQIILRDGGHTGALSIEPTATSPSGLAAAPAGHSTLMLTFVWPRPLRSLTIHYGLFLPGVSTASCLATILRDGRIQTFVFTPTAQEVSFAYGSFPARLGRILRTAGAGVVSSRGQGLLGLFALMAVLGGLVRTRQLRAARMVNRP